MDGITGHKMRGRVGPRGRLETTKRVGKELKTGSHFLGGGFKHFLFSSLFGEDFHFD